MWQIHIRNVLQLADLCDGEDQNGGVHRCLHAIMHLIEDHAEKAGISARFASSELAENDQGMMQLLNLSHG